MEEGSHVHIFNNDNPYILFLDNFLRSFEDPLKYHLQIVGSSQCQQGQKKMFSNAYIQILSGFLTGNKNLS
jgi:hypothetical protein